MLEFLEYIAFGFVILGLVIGWVILLVHEVRVYKTRIAKDEEELAFFKEFKKFLQNCHF